VNATDGQVRNVVLVHGAYADGSSWSEVITRLQAAGLTATAVQNPLTSLGDDVAHTRRILAMQDGPTILAGHSFAGTVITEAGTTHASSVWCTSPPGHLTRARTRGREFCLFVEAEVSGGCVSGPVSHRAKCVA
jgi:pimeloyl-ACP methyl ester carboxylesterase